MVSYPGGVYFVAGCFDRGDTACIAAKNAEGMPRMVEKREELKRPPLCYRSAIRPLFMNNVTVV